MICSGRQVPKMTISGSVWATALYSMLLSSIGVGAS